MSHPQKTDPKNAEQEGLFARVIEPSGSFRLLQRFAPAQFESVKTNLGLRGYGDLARYLVSEWTFDRRYGVRTEFLVPPEKLDFADPKAQAQSSRYRPTPPFCVATSFGRLRERIGSLSDQHLVDYGAGAGRVLILAAEAGFGKVTGLELSPDLVRQAKENLSASRAKRRFHADWDVLQQDATSYAPPPEATVFYFFNPFSTAFMDRSIEGLRSSLRAKPRVIWVMIFQTFRYEIPGLDLVGEVTGVKTYTNGLAPERFLSSGLG